MRIKIEGGTAINHSINLCESCKHVWIREDHNSKKLTMCTVNDMGSGPIKLVRSVYKCNKWEDFKAITLYEMKQQAYIIVPGREHLGFRKYAKLDKTEQEGVDDTV